MKEWIIENTTVTEEEYDSLINFNTVLINGKGKKHQKNELSNHPIIDIALFTMNKPTFFQRKKLKVIKRKDQNFKNYYIYKSIQFYILSEFLKDFKYTLYNSSRHRQCFFLNSKICSMINIKSYLITAICKMPYIKSNEDYLHTFILIVTDDNQEYIIDATANIIMNKSTYFNIFKPKIISCINKEQLQKDLELIKTLEEAKVLYRAEYLCFPEQVITSAKKLTKN